MASQGFGEFLGNFAGGTGSGGGIMQTVYAFLIAIVAIAVIGGIVFFIMNKKKWNLKVEVKLPRSDGRMYSAEWAKGAYITKTGVVWIKRKGMAKCAMKPFDIKRYLQGGENILTVIQVGSADYKPMLPESFDVLVDDKTGEEGCVMKFLTDTTESKSWKNSFERDSKNAYSVQNWLRENGAMIAIGMVIFLWGLQFIILYMKIKG